MSRLRSKLSKDLNMDDAQWFPVDEMRKRLAAMLEQQAAAIRAHFDEQEDAFYTSGRVLDHGIIDPRDTRKVLAFSLETALEARLRETRPNAFGVARM